MMRKKRRSSVDKGEGATSTTKAKKSRSTGRQRKEAAPEETNESVFSVFLREAGVTLKKGGTSNEIAVDQVVFQKRIQQQLRKSPRYPGIVQEFITGLESHIEDHERFRNCLLPCVPQLPDGDARSVSSFQESLLRMLLGIEMLQTPIINTLLEKLPEFMLDGTGDGGLSIPRIIINQLKWLDRVVDSKELASKLMELVSVAPVDVQRDIITSLPEILEDSQHNDIARELNILLQTDTQLTVPVLDALSSLNLSSSLLTEVRGAVMATLAAVQLEDLPVVVKFILHSVSASDAYEVVNNLRKKLELEQCVLPPVLQASQSRMKSKGGAVSASTPAAGSSVTLILDGIKSAVRFQKSISEAWVKAIESVDEAENHKVIDLLVLFILHSTNANQSRRGAEKVLKAKVRTGLIQDTLLQRTFRDYSQVMRGYFPSILALAQSLLRSPDPGVVPFGGHMYQLSFTVFESYCQQVGCPLILTDMDVIEKIESLSKAEREFLCNLLFHTINWFREVVNAFCRQKETELKMKVMTRLQNITYVQTLLERALAGTPGYVPPVANFDGESTDGLILSSAAPVNKAKKDGTGKKRKAPSKSSSEGSSQLDETTEADETLQEQPEKEKEKEVRQGVSLMSYRQFFRELDMEVLSVLQCGLLSRSLLDSELHSKVQEEVMLGPAELVFLLEDMLRKVEFSLRAAPAKRAPFLKGRTDKSVGFSHLQQRSSKDIASYCVQLLPALCSHLEDCHNHFQTLLSENNGVVDGPATDVQEHQLMSYSYQLLLQILNTTFCWSGFSLPGQRSLLKKALGVLAERLKEQRPDLTLEQLVKHSFEYLLNFRSTMPSLSTALCLSQLLSTVSAKGGNSATYREQAASLAKRFLSQEWVTASGEKERGNKFNEALQTLLSIYLEHVDDVLKAVEEIAGEGIPELLNASKDESSASWPTLNRQTFLVFYKVMMAELEKAIRKIPAGKISDNSEAQSEKLLTWNLAVRDFHILVNLVKVFDSRPVLNVCLKYGRLFLESFLKLGMPLLDYSFKRHKEDVQSLLKTFQLSTRQLHHMCGHSKIQQDTSLTNHVPALKKSLELFLYRVKAMLMLNNCQEAFWMGNLKNRNLKGEEILSQRSSDDEEEEEQHSLLPQEQSEDEAQESDSEESKKINIEEDVDPDDITDDSDD
ncbi:Fanconi anemia group D2 protein [Seriola lalandi dorsalis]|uniref:Fanconi anemia group D2 protein n=1 Tax=Seriola lalandi dorsalis TaxID=1841481 RepID=UPI000C6FC5D5|nr:Fanconi anemia group D2 protein [Seriola lalandi dorsalis]